MKTLLPYLLALTIAVPLSSHAQQTPEAASQIQKLLSDPKNSDALGKALAVGTLLGCTQKQAGKEATEQFYQQIQAVGKNVSAYCIEGHATEARALVLSTLEENQTSPVYQAALGCYETNAAKINSLAGVKASAKFAEFHGWAKDIPAAKQNLKESDICKPKTPSNK